MPSYLTSALFLSIAAAVPAWTAPKGWKLSPAHFSRPMTSSTPFKFPLDNGFPNIMAPSAALMAIEEQAHGTLPNGALPDHLNMTSIIDFRVIATNELFEVAYFTSLLCNITGNVPGYEIKNPYLKQGIVAALAAIQAQEELHAIGANAILANVGAVPIAPCEYTFPVNNLNDAILLAATFTDVVVGTLQGVQSDLSAGGDGALIPLVGSIIGQESQQTGSYRAVEQRIPSELPFLTASAGPLAYSALNQMFIVPGSCPQSIPEVPIFGALTVVTKPEAKDHDITFSFMHDGSCDVGDLSLVYINQQNVPIVEKLMNVRSSGGMVMFEAAFPYKENLMNGLTIAAVTKGAGPFMNAAAVAGATMYGPGLMVIN